MKFKIDENLPAEIGGVARAHGHEAHSVLEERLGGSPDDAVARVCREEDRVLITLDLDFADIRSYPPELSPGIIVLRLARLDRESVLALMPRILTLLETEPIRQRLWIVDEKRTRIRGGE